MAPTRRAVTRLACARKSADPFLPAVYYAMIDGAFYLTLNEPTLKGVIDSIAAKKTVSCRPWRSIPRSIFRPPRRSTRSRSCSAFWNAKRTNKR